jgi:hypothetical protein
LDFYLQVSKNNVKELKQDNLIAALVDLSKKSEKKYVNVAKAIAVIIQGNPSILKANTSKFVKDLGGKGESVCLALHTLGEIGCRLDVSDQADIKKSILTSFSSTEEEIRNSASFALGSIAVGNLEKFLPEILAEIKSNAKQRYLLMHSLREVIVQESNTTEGMQKLQPFQDKLLPILYENSENSEESVRNVVAECLGKLALVNPASVVPTLVERVSSSNASVRGTVVNSLKYAVTDRALPVDKILLPQIPKFMATLKDQDLGVRKNALLALNYIAHNKPSLIRPTLPEYLPLIYGETKVKKELIRVVDLGPFKHQVDDGLELRKAAFETMYTLLDTCVDRTDVTEFITALVDGLNDVHDIKMLTNLMLIRLTHVASAALMESLDKLVEPLRAIVTTKAKEGSVKQEIEKNDELVKSALRAVAAIHRNPNSESNHKFSEFIRTVVLVEFADKFAAVNAELEHSLDAVNFETVV